MKRFDHMSMMHGDHIQVVFVDADDKVAAQYTPEQWRHKELLEALGRIEALLVQLMALQKPTP